MTSAMTSAATGSVIDGQTPHRSYPPTRTRALLLSGVVAGPLFHAVVLVQEAYRDDFDPRRHPLSLLALGGHGWIQVTNFVVTGLLVVLSAVGLRAVLRAPSERARTWGPILFTVNGLTLVVAGVFRTDPYNGYPVGAAEAVTWHGTVHSAAPSLSAVAGLACFVVFGRRFAGLGQRGWMASCVVTPVLVLGLSAASVATSDFRLMVLGDAAGWLWTSAVLLHLSRRVALGAG